MAEFMDTRKRQNEQQTNGVAGQAIKLCDVLGPNNFIFWVMAEQTLIDGGRLREWSTGEA